MTKLLQNSFGVRSVMDYGGKLFSIENWMPDNKKAKKMSDDLKDKKELKSKKGIPGSFKKLKKKRKKRA